MDYLVTRHAGALAWMQCRLKGGPFTVLSHLEPSFAPAAGDRVFGVLPLSWVERIHRAHAEAWVLEVELPASLRGRELRKDELDALEARLVRYEATALDSVR